MNLLEYIDAVVKTFVAIAAIILGIVVLNSNQRKEAVKALVLTAALLVIISLALVAYTKLNIEKSNIEKSNIEKLAVTDGLHDSEPSNDSSNGKNFQNARRCPEEKSVSSLSPNKVKALVGTCWEPCDGVLVFVDEIYLDTNGNASDRVAIDWRDRGAGEMSYQIGDTIQLQKNCQIGIEDTGDTLYSQYVNLRLISNPE